MKKIIIITIVSFLLIISFIFFYKNPNWRYSFSIYINWNKYIPIPDNTKVIYNYNYREGQDLDIWQYNNNKTNKIKNLNYFKKMNKKNVEKQIKEYYKKLDEQEKKLYNKNININELTNNKNYYAFLDVPKENRYILLILDTNENKLYLFHENL